jgi:S1-C subfamily serine protease
VIVAVNGERVTRRSTLSELIAQYAPGESVSIEYLREGAARTADIVLGVSK